MFTKNDLSALSSCTSRYLLKSTLTTVWINQYASPHIAPVAWMPAHMDQPEPGQAMGLVQTVLLVPEDEAE